MRTILFFLSVSAVAPPQALHAARLGAHAQAPREDAVVTLRPGLRSTFDGGDVVVEFDTPEPQELVFAVNGIGVVRDVRCDDAWAAAWLSRDAECSSPEPRAIGVGGLPLYLCVRVEATAFEEGGVGVCRAGTSEGQWVLRYTTTAP